MWADDAKEQKWAKIITLEGGGGEENAGGGNLHNWAIKVSYITLLECCVVKGIKFGCPLHAHLTLLATNFEGHVAGLEIGVGSRFKATCEFAQENSNPLP